MSAAPLIAPIALYRFFDADDNLLYVGISGRPSHRWKEHAKKPWWSLVARNTVEWLDGIEAARAAERETIRTELPIHNRNGKPKPPKPPKPPRQPRPRKPRKSRPDLRGGDRHSTNRVLITLDDDLWNEFGEAVGSRERSRVIRELIAWYLRKGGAKTPSRPKAEPSD